MVGRRIALIELIEAQHRAVVLREHHTAVDVGNAGGKLLDLVPVRVRTIQREARARDRVAVLVDLDDVGVGNGHEVELETHVRGTRAPLKVEETQRVLGAALESARITVESGGLRPRRFELVPHGAIRAPVDLDGARFKINAQRRLVVDAAEVSHQDVIHKDPYVVVSGELEDHRVTLRRHAVLGLHEPR